VNGEEEFHPGRSFVSEGALTGIGSLPFEDADQAVAFVAEHSPEIPFWPQLLVSDTVGALVAQVLPSLGHSEPGAAGWHLDQVDLARLRESAVAGTNLLGASQVPGLHAFLRAGAEGAFPMARAVKGQVTGPLTLAWLLRVNGVRAIEVEALVELLAQLVLRHAVAQIEALRALGHPVIIFVDEPALRLVADHRHASADLALLRGVCAAIKSAGATVGLHCCALVDLGQLCATEADIVSFDAVEGMAVPIEDRATLEYWSAGGTLAFGLVRSEGDGPPATTEALFARWLAAGSYLGDVSDLAQRTLVTATCGLALQTPAWARSSFVQASELGSLIRRVARGPGDR
jgi:hypothetical protein